MRSGLVVFVALALAGRATGQSVDYAKLRKAARLPHISVTSGIGFNCAGKLIVAGEPSDPRAEIAALETALQGDSSDALRYWRLGTLYASLKHEETSNKAHARALALYRQRLEREPDNGLLLSEYGEAVWSDGKLDQAETILRQAVKSGPRARGLARGFTAIALRAQKGWSPWGDRNKAPGESSSPGASLAGGPLHEPHAITRGVVPPAARPRPGSVRPPAPSAKRPRAGDSGR